MSAGGDSRPRSGVSIARHPLMCDTFSVKIVEICKSMTKIFYCDLRLIGWIPLGGA